MAEMSMVALMPSDMLIMTPRTDARTPAAPLIPQNQGVGWGSMASTSRMPVGKAKPSRKPKGMMTAMEMMIRMRRTSAVVCSKTRGRKRTRATR